MSRNKLFVVRMEICLTKEQKKKLEKASKDASMTMNEVVRDLINSYC